MVFHGKDSCMYNGSSAQLLLNNGGRTKRG